MCSNIPGLTGLQLDNGEQFMTGVCVVQTLTETLDNAARGRWSKFMGENACLQPSRPLQEAVISNDWAFHYKTKAGRTTVALRIPGIEFVVQNMSGQKAGANREKFLLLIEDWKRQQASVLGKRAAPTSSSSGAPGSKVARIEGGVANALVLRSIKTMSAVSGAVTVLNTKMDAGFDRVEGSVLAMTSKVDVVKDRVKEGTTEVKKLAASVDANNRQQLKDKDAQIKRLQEDKQTLQEANERQRVQIAKLNKERNDLLKAPTSSDPKLIALCERVDGISRSLAGVNTVAFNSREKMSTLGRDMQAMHATATAQLKDLQEIKAFLAAIAAAVAP